MRTGGVGAGEAMAAALSRRELIHRAAVGGAAIVVGGSMATTARSGPSTARDARIIGMALRLERLQAGLYAQALRAGSIAPELLAFARAALEHDQEHVATLAELLGSAAGEPPPPEADVRRAATDDAGFAQMAIRLEDLGVRHLNGQVRHLTARALEQTARIASVDARHAAWIRGLAGVTPAHHVLDTGLPPAAASDALRPGGPLP